MYESPDVGSSYQCPQLNSPNPHHHLELCNRRDTIVIAHPNYLKIRLFSTSSGTLHAGGPQVPLLLDSALLHDLAALYQP